MSGMYRQRWRIGEPGKRGQMIGMTMSSIALAAPENSELAYKMASHLIKQHGVGSVGMMGEDYLSAEHLAALQDAEDERDGN